MKYSRIALHKLKTNPKNPRLIKNNKFKMLMDGITKLPSMLDSRPIICDENHIILGGNMRHKACKELKWNRIPYDMFTREKAEEMNAKAKEKGNPEYTYEEYCDMMVIADNVSYGEWDTEMIGTEWDLDQFDEWGASVGATGSGSGETPKVEFSEYLDEEHNYVVLYFDNRIDWLQAETHFDMKSVSSKRANGKPWSKGVGRVINGSKYLKKLNDEDNFIEI